MPISSSPYKIAFSKIQTPLDENTEWTIVPIFLTLATSVKKWGFLLLLAGLFLSNWAHGSSKIFAGLNLLWSRYWFLLIMVGWIGMLLPISTVSARLPSAYYPHAIYDFLCALMIMLYLGVVNILIPPFKICKFSTESDRIFQMQTRMCLSVTCIPCPPLLFYFVMLIGGVTY